jgi:ABC-type Fe3+/spermidine/putrescine transport system ATPase subunit
MIFQDLALWPHMQVRENVVFGLSGHGIEEVRKRVASVLQWVSLQEHSRRYPHQLSGGEQQRLAIARALAPGHPYLLMDEPFSSLDPVLKEEMIRLVKQLHEQLHTAILYVTHNLDEALALADRVLLMDQGRIVDELGKDALGKLSQPDLLQWYREGLSL